jgi:hypothetical protein
MWQRGMDAWPKGNQVAPPQPTMNYSDDITVDGNLSDWAGATFTPMTFAYDPQPLVNSDMSNAAYSFKWGAGGTKVYLALKVQDSHTVRMNTYTNWNVNDHVEAQIWASSQSGVINQTICNPSQQYEFGLKTDGVTSWATLTGGQEIPDFADFHCAATAGVGGWVYYEAAMTPFQAFDIGDMNNVIAKVLAVDDVIGADAVIGSVNGTGQFNMLAANNMTGKSANTNAILKQKLVRDGVMGSVTLQNYEGTVLGIPGTATITDGTNTEVHNIVLDAAGLYSFTTALRGDCTVIVKCSHWLGKAASVTVPSTGNVVVDLLSVLNGDVVDSNEVDFADINAVRNAFGSAPGDDNWNANADVDGSGEVDFADINIVRNNFGQAGD